MEADSENISSDLSGADTSSQEQFPFIESPEEESDLPPEESADYEKIEQASQIELQVEETDELISPEQEEEGETDQIPESDYSGLEKEGLVASMITLIENYPVLKIRTNVENIRSNFYKRLKSEFAEKKAKFIAEGGDGPDVRIPEDPLENEFKNLYKRYRELRNAANNQSEKDKEDNLRLKYSIIDELKELVNNNESFHRTFQDFRELQQRWRETGLVPQKKMKELWESYNYQVEKFYDFIKINRELRDLDLKKNLEFKIELCEKAEELLIEGNLKRAVFALQKYHDQWRETGPVPKEKKDEVWERFREITYKINKKYQEHLEKLKQDLENNLQAKTVLCEKAEEINHSTATRIRQWETHTKEILDLQRMWNMIGPVHRKSGHDIYMRFKSACDSFFSRKRDFFHQIKDEESNNLQQKTDLCIQAESMKESTDWKKTTEEFIRLQEKWKSIGPVPRKKSEETWNRFRTTCNSFFTRKADYFSQKDAQLEGNLKKKEEILRSVLSLQLSGELENDLKVLKQFQKEWTEVGQVPIKDKNNLQDQFRKAINQHFDLLDMDDKKRELLKFRMRLDNLVQLPNSAEKLKTEKEKIQDKLKQLKSDITLWDNNVGFFARSKNSESLLKDINDKIESGKKLLDLLREKIKMIDRYEKQITQ